MKVKTKQKEPSSQLTVPNGGHVVSERRVRRHGTVRTAEWWEVVQVWLSNWHSSVG